MAGRSVPNPCTAPPSPAHRSLPPSLLLSPLMQDKHVETAKLLLGEGPVLTGFVARLLDDMSDLKAMLHAISIGALAPRDGGRGA